MQVVRGRYVKESDPERLCKCGRNMTRNYYGCTECWTEKGRYMDIQVYCDSLCERKVGVQDDS